MADVRLIRRVGVNAGFVLGSEGVGACLADVLSLKLIFGALVLGVLALVGWTTQPTELAMILWAGLSVVIFAGSRESALGVFKGAQDFRSLFIVNLAGGGL